MRPPKTFIDEFSFDSCKNRHDWVRNESVQNQICRECGKAKKWIT